MERKARAATFSGIFLLIFGAVMVAINVLAYPLNKRMDVTKNERWTLSKGSANLVRTGLTEEMKATLYVTRGLPSYDIFLDDLLELMKEYEKASQGNFKYFIKEPRAVKDQKKREEMEEEARTAGLQEIPLRDYDVKGDAETTSKGFMGMVLEYGAEKAVLPVLSPNATTGLEFWITNKIRELRDKEDNRSEAVGVITKDGIKLTDTNLLPPQQGKPNVQQIFQQHLPFYKIEDVDLEEGKAEINPELRGVIILQPDKDFTEPELARIDEFMMRGDKSLLVLAGAVNMKPSDAKMTGEISTRGLDKLMGPYGIEMKKNAVFDWELALRLPVLVQGGAAYIFHPAMLQLPHVPGLEEEKQPLDNSFAGFFRMDELAFPFPSTLVPHPEKQPGATFTVVARTSESATVEEGERVDLALNPDVRPKGDFGQHAIALQAEGTLKAAFAKGSRPDGVSDYAAETPADKPSRVLVIASGQFLANPFARAGNPPPMPPQMAMMGGSFGGDRNLQQISMPYAQKYYMTTLLSFMNLLDWMANDKDLMAVSAKLLGNSTLTYSDVERPTIDVSKDDEAAIKAKLEDYKLEREKLQGRVQWSLTLVPPLFFLLFGVGRWRLRESRRGRMKL